MSLRATKKRYTLVKGSAHWETYPFAASDEDVEFIHTWLGQGDQIRHILHEDAAFQLEFRFALFVGELFR